MTQHVNCPSKVLFSIGMLSLRARDPDLVSSGLQAFKVTHFQPTSQEDLGMAEHTVIFTALPQILTIGTM